MKEEFYLFTFESTHGAISTEKLLKHLGVTIMPVPRMISTSCGIAVKVEPGAIDVVSEVFKKGTDLSDDEYKVYKISQDKSIGLFDCEVYQL